uniref:HAT C-terminal dimerisation domain-containing protein n=1 Tax=Sinocyclocheilus rhinocerous TaxID=307959 RepID=A0A673JU36_9TELE
RISEIQCQIQEKLKNTIDNCKYFSLALDESTDVSDVSQLLIFFEVPLKGNFDIQEELLNIASLHGTTKGEDIFKADENTVHEYGGFAKLSAVVTDGAPAMQGTKSGFTGLLQKSGINCPVLHCIIHQVISSAYGDLLMHTDIRWMSHGKCLERFFALRNEIPLFLEDNVKSDMSDYCCKLRDPEFLCDMAFLTDMTTHLNNLNTQLQGRAQTVSNLYAHMNAFQHKLNLFHNGFSSVLSKIFFAKYRKVIESFQEQFKIRFQDFHDMQPCIDLVEVPLSTAVSEQPGEMQLELWELQSDPFFQARRNERGLEFWKLLPDTYICESSFSTMKHIKSKERNRLTDDTLFQLLQVVSTNFEIDIESIVHQQDRPQVSH